MTGQVVKMFFGRYFFMLGKDKRQYFGAFEELPRWDRRHIHRHSVLEFDVSPDDPGDGKALKAINMRVIIERPRTR